MKFAEEKKQIKSLTKELAEIESKLSQIYRDTNYDFDKSYPLTKDIFSRKREIESEIISLKAMMVDVGDKISISPYTDWQSYTVIKRTKFTLTCQADRQTHFKTSWQDGERHCERDVNGKTIVLHWSKKYKWWSYNIYKVALGERNYEDPSF